MQKILIANRGEIAVRIISTIKEMGLESIAVYSDVDRSTPHVALADQAVLLGAAPPSESYLSISKIVDAAMSAGADAIHPGYGFLSENAEFARAVVDAGMTFIGPTPEAMEIMGSKLTAKSAVGEYGIPMVPGSDTAIQNTEEALIFARSIGFPVLIKASAGGGGKGMRIVDSEEEFESQLERAQSEALKAFGDDSVFVEKYITSPRHIEIQILADQHGNYIHLGERECSIQRRHQKVIEEAPSTLLTDEMRTKMGEAAIGVAKSCNYVGAGTVEFIVDEELNYFFLEMNTRLQVEHPVTEMTTGYDLVEHQIRVARGETLSISQDDVRSEGHAIELRVYAEDPLDNFLPGTGSLTRYAPPTGDGIRVDDGLREGLEISLHYDPMIAKLIVHAETRQMAIQKMAEAIKSYKIEGVPNTLVFGSFVMESEAFRSGNFNTHFVRDHFDPHLLHLNSETAHVAALLAAKLQSDHREKVHISNGRASETK
jgi:acetyl-CoA carboxylase biotin carboxylase subunit